MGNSNSRKTRPKPRNSLSKIYNGRAEIASPLKLKQNECLPMDTTVELDTSVVNAALSERAYRHHRKRLARIVADQWMYAARLRLATLKFRRQRELRIARICITAWKTVVEHGLRMSRNLDRVTTISSIRVKGRSFYKWKKYVRSKQALVLDFERKAARVRLKKQSKIIDALLKHSEAKIIGRQLLVKARRVSMLHVLKRCWSTWSFFVKERLFKECKAKKLHAKWTNRKLKLFLGQWKASALMNKVAYDYWTKHQLRVALKAWRFCSLATAEGSRTNGRPEECQKQVLIPVSNNAVGAECDAAMQSQLLTACFWRWYLLVSQRSKWLTDMWMHIGDLLLR